jgi:hypothetical protein
LDDECGASLNRITVADVVDRVLGLGFGVLTVVGFLPLFVLWAMPAFFLVLVFYLATQEGDLSHRRAVMVLVVAILLHAGVKVASTGGLMERLSPDGLPAMPGITTAVRWGVPVVVAGLAAVAMVIYNRRSGNSSLFVSFFVFVLVDVVLFALLSLGPLLLVG